LFNIVAVKIKILTFKKKESNNNKISKMENNSNILSHQFKPYSALQTEISEVKKSPILPSPINLKNNLLIK